MLKRLILPALLSLLVMSTFVIGCGDDSTGPEEEKPDTFSGLMGGSNCNAYAVDVVSNPDELRIVGGIFYGAMSVTGAPDSLVSTKYDLFLVAYRADGTLAWKKKAGGAEDEYLAGMTRDAADNIYIGGAFRGDTSIGSSILSSQGLQDALVARFDANGNPVWAIGGGVAGEDYVWDIAASSNGELFVCGVASSEMILAGEDMGEFSSSSGFLVNIHPNGVGVWAATAYGSGTAECRAVITTGTGDVLVAGEYNGSTVEISGVILAAGAYDTFIARYSVSGTPEGAIRIGGSGATRFHEITHIDGGAVVAGELSGTEDFDLAAPGGEETAGSGSDAVIARYNVDGTFRWVRRIDLGSNETALDVCRIDATDLLVVGTFDTNASNNRDYFLAQLDANGNVKSTVYMGGPGDDASAAVKAAGDGSALVVGYAETGEFTFPDGSKRTALGASGFIFQRP